MGAAKSNVVAVTVAAPVAAPVLKGVLNTLGDQIYLTWSSLTSGITAWTLYKNANNNGFAVYQTFAGSQLEYLDIITDDPVDDIDYAAYYLIAAVGSRVSGPSNEVDNDVGNTEQS